MEPRKTLVTKTIEQEEHAGAITFFDFKEYYMAGVAQLVGA